MLVIIIKHNRFWYQLYISFYMWDYKYNLIIITRKKNDFAAVFKNVTRYRSENNFVGSSK